MAFCITIMIDLPSKKGLSSTTVTAAIGCPESFSNVLPVGDVLKDLLDLVNYAHLKKGISDDDYATFTGVDLEIVDLYQF